jgi:hypothetical protein
MNADLGGVERSCPLRSSGLGSDRLLDRINGIDRKGTGRSLGAAAEEAMGEVVEVVAPVGGVVAVGAPIERPARASNS